MKNILPMDLQTFADPAPSKEFLLNFKNKVEIDVAGNKSLDAIESADFALLAAGISTITPAAADTTDATPYYDGEGFTESEVTGKNITFAISGHRVFGDKAKGNKVQAVVTMTSIVPFGGAANAKQTFSFTLAFNGKPVLEEAGE